MTPEELSNFISDHCQDIYTMGGVNYEHMPIAFVENDKGELTIIACAVERQHLRPMFEKIARDGAAMIGFVTEGWAAKLIDSRGRRPSEMPPDDRKEVLVCDVVAKPDQHICWTRTIHRNAPHASLGPKVTNARSWNAFLHNLPWR